MTTRVRRDLGVLLACVASLAACASPEEKLLDRRQALRSTIDELYAKYRSEEPAESTKGSAAASPGLLQRFVTEIDRAHFEEYCLAMGRGERAFTLSARVEAFMSDGGNARTCRKAARLEAEVAALEREVASRKSAPAG